ncbi:hypothetical protein BDF14DRAFT_1879402 [Spinellus fusiger]|nr:hypothetical protein BDF14DRAFT_1879402 [Spinellus fusiger]
MPTPPRTLMHLRVTQSKAMRLLLYVPSSYADDWDEQHTQAMMKLLVPVVRDSLLHPPVPTTTTTTTTTKQKQPHVLYPADKKSVLGDIALVYQFMPYTPKQVVMIRSEHSSTANTNTTMAYAPLSLVSFQLAVSPVPHSKALNLDTYFSIVE